MLKYLLIGVALLASWLYFTESGQLFFMERLQPLMPKKEEPAFVPDPKEVRRLEGLIAEKDAKLAVLRKELEAEAKVRAKKEDRTAFRTDPAFLETAIGREEAAKKALEAQLGQVKRPPTGFNVR